MSVLVHPAAAFTTTSTSRWSRTGVHQAPSRDRSVTTPRMLLGRLTNSAPTSIGKISSEEEWGQVCVATCRFAASFAPRRSPRTTACRAPPPPPSQNLQSHSEKVFVVKFYSKFCKGSLFSPCIERLVPLPVRSRVHSPSPPPRAPPPLLFHTACKRMAPKFRKAAGDYGEAPANAMDGATFEFAEVEWSKNKELCK